MQIDRVVTTGLLDLVDPPVDVENNVWLVGDDESVLVVDASHDLEAIIAAIDNRRVTTIACTHGHLDHINRALELADATEAPIGLHPADMMLWERVYPDRPPDIELLDGVRIDIGNGRLTVLHTPGHTPGSVSLAMTGEVFGGDTLFRGGPGATEFEFGDFDTIIESITSRLFVLPDSTKVHPGHGPSTTVGAELPDLETWLAVREDM